MKNGDDIRRDEWLESLRRRDLAADIRDGIFAFIIAAVCFGALWARADDGGVDPHVLPDDSPVLDVMEARITMPDGGVVDVQGGGWLRDDVLMARSRELVATQAELDALKATPKPVASTPLVVVSNILTGIVHTFMAAGTACLAATGDAFCRKH